MPSTRYPHFRLSDQHLVSISHLLYELHLILFDRITVIIFGEKHELRSSSLYNFLQPPVTSS
jgi:hypothetical protein